jgi:exodeoxyribonuclease V gamma subunit
VLLEAYWAGLKQPLRFFPRSSFAYAEAVPGQEVPGRAMSAAEHIWRPQSREIPGEGDEPYNKLAFRNCDPLDKDFAELALAILEPLLTHREKQ